MSKITHLLPFMEAEELKELAIKIINKEVNGVKLHMLYPFISHSDLDELVDLMIEKDQGKELQLTLPFLSNEKLASLLEAVRDGRVHGLSEHMFYPFLSREKIKDLFYQYVDEMNQDNESDNESEDESEDES